MIIRWPIVRSYTSYTCLDEHPACVHTISTCLADRNRKNASLAYMIYLVVVMIISNRTSLTFKICSYVYVLWDGVIKFRVMLFVYWKRITVTRETLRYASMCTGYSLLNISKHVRKFINHNSLRSRKVGTWYVVCAPTHTLQRMSRRYNKGDQSEN